MKEVVTGDNYKQIVLKRMITLCWILLTACFVIKLFGGNFFAFIGESKVVEYIASNLWLFSIVQFVFYTIQSLLYFGVIFKDKHIALTAVITIVCYAVKLLTVIFGLPIIISFIIEMIGLIILPIIINKREWYMPLVMNIAIIIFQVISMFTKNIGIIDFPYENVVGYVFMIDYYIMLTLNYLYYKRRNFNMTLGFWFLSKDKEQLESYKDIVVKRRDKKVNKYNKKINKIEERIAKC